MDNKHGKYVAYDVPVVSSWVNVGRAVQVMQEQLGKSMAEAIDRAILAGETGEVVAQHFPPPPVKWYVRLGRAVSWWWYGVRVWICVYVLGLDPHGDWEDDN